MGGGVGDGRMGVAVGTGVSVDRAVGVAVGAGVSVGGTGVWVGAGGLVGLAVGAGVVAGAHAVTSKASTTSAASVIWLDLWFIGTTFSGLLFISYLPLFVLDLLKLALPYSRRIEGSKGSTQSGQVASGQKFIRSWTIVPPQPSTGSSTTCVGVSDGGSVGEGAGGSPYDLDAGHLNTATVGIHDAAGDLPPHTDGRARVAQTPQLGGKLGVITRDAIIHRVATCQDKGTP